MNRRTLFLLFVIIHVALLPFIASAQSLWGTSPIKEPYPAIRSGGFSGPAAPLSPDPLVAYRWPDPKAADGLEIYLQKPEKVTTDSPGAFENLQSLTGDKPAVKVKATGSIQIDFGRESAAWLEFDSPDFSGDVEMSISEYNEPAAVNRGPESPVKTKKPVKHGKTYRLELNQALYEGVRFGWVHVRTFDKPWHITAVRLVCQTKPANYEGGFACSDPRLTRIWYTGAYTVKLNQVHDYFGAILMDRGDRHSWTGDAYPAQAAAMVAFGNRDFVKANLDRTAGNSNDIESYSLCWILSLMDYYRYSGDVAALRQHAANARAKLDHGNGIYANPRIAFYGWDERLGAGFEEANSIPETKHAYRMLFIRACREFSEGMDSLGESAVAETYRKMAGQRVAELRTNNSWHAPFGLHAAAESVNAGFTTPIEQKQLFDREFSDRATRISFSAFNQYFVIQAMARMNRYDEALASIHDHWGGQLEYGGTTFFETFWPAWTQLLGKNDAVPNGQAGYTSLCHPWGAGVTKWLTEETLGIKPATPGFATYDVFPHLGRTLTSVSGSVPTPKGTIRAAFDVARGLGRLTAPAGTIGRLGIPTVGKEIKSIHINGRLAWMNGVFHPVPGIGGAGRNEDFVIFNDVRPGTYEITMQYSGETPKFTDGPWRFPTTFVREDLATSGNWVGKYGRDGSVLFGEDTASTRSLLPSYVTAVTVRKGRFSGWTAGGDPRALVEGPTNDTVRRGGVLYSDNPAVCQQDLVVDIMLKQPAEFQLALYFVDFDRKGRRQSLELFDLESRKLIAPTRIYSNFTEGTYAVYTCRQSVRIRVNHIRGDNAVLNGLFFDPPNKP
ncbi:MAG: alpha-L-rhamnosidase C-terminal domain-containing protein [Verrucomicrobiota bacterium]